MNVGGIEFNSWDIVLITVVSAQSTLLAYLHSPRWKALLLNLPLPFTVAVLSVGQPVDVTNIAGFLLLFIYTHSVRILNWRFGIPIIAAIVISAAAYCALGTVLSAILPKTATAFWMVCAIVLATAVFFNRKLSPRDEPGHRSSLPVGVKFVVIVCVITVLVVMKKHLQGFMTMFPMVGLTACYEGRHCLWTICRQIPIVMMTMLPMVIVIRLAQPYLGYAWSLAPGWLVFLAALALITLAQSKSDVCDDPSDQSEQETAHA